jgi:hypothetical protein
VVNLTDWIPNVQKQISSIAIPNVQDSVRNACRKFCEETWIWKNTLALIDILADTAEYTLTIPTALHAELEAVPRDGVRYKTNGADETTFYNLICTSEDDLDSMYPGWRYETHPTPSRFYVDNIDKHLHLYPKPEDASTDGLEVSVILTPDRTTLTVPDFLYDDYELIIEAGALEDLMSRKNTPYYDLQEAGRYGNIFRLGYNDAKMKRFTGPTNKPMQIKMGYFA